MSQSSFTLSKHASQKIAERHIAQDWIERVLAVPAQVEPDKRDPALRLASAPIAERDGRVLCVVYNVQRVPPHVVTVFFQRKW